MEAAFPTQNPAFAVLESLSGQLDAAQSDVSAAVKRYAKKKNADTRSGVEQALARAAALHAQFDLELERVRASSGITAEMVEHFEAQESESDYVEQRYWKDSILEAPPTGRLEDYLPQAMGALTSFLDIDWLKSEASKPYRLGQEFFAAPMHLVAGVHLARQGAPSGPQRFARMLLLGKDFLTGARDYDFYEGAALVPELAQLGARAHLVDRMGEQATKKLQGLASLSDLGVTGAIYELLVGTAAVARGYSVEMLDPLKFDGKAPDFKLNKFSVPAVIECKRRPGLSEYEVAEARAVEALYDAARQPLDAYRGAVSLEVEFKVEVASIPAPDFVAAVQLILDRGDGAPQAAPWGVVRAEAMPFTVSLDSPCPTYSPAFLDRVFGWNQESQIRDPTVGDLWDGLLCEVEPPFTLWVQKAVLPRCMKWRCIDQKALTKKSRGVSSLIGDAFNQIPDGEWGFVFVAYPEGGRREGADARTKDLLDRAKTFWHRGSIGVPMLVVNRIFARPIGLGQPDLIESTIPMYEGDLRSALRGFPTSVLVPEPGRKRRT